MLLFVAPSCTPESLSDTVIEQATENSGPNSEEAEEEVEPNN